MVLWIEKDECTGCGVCANKCPINAISMREDDLSGFWYPYVDDGKCMNCNKCKYSCPIIQYKNNTASRLHREKNNINPRCYAVKSMRDELRFESTSGGIVSEIASVILSRGGRVYGAGYDKHMNVHHLYIDTISDLHKIQKSKYVQSDTRGIYRSIEQDINSGVEVLFIGCPCQVAGLYSFLGVEYDNLYTIEFICMGVNSPIAYRSWIEEIERDAKEKVTFIWFKYKKHGWRESPFCTRIDFESGRSMILDLSNNYFMKGYLQGSFYVRHSCSRCKFIGMNRAADLVIGDHWGAEANFDDNKGTSVVIINKTHGDRLFNDVKKQVEYIPISIESIMLSNPRFETPIPDNQDRARFLSEIGTKKFSELVKKYIGPDEQLCEIMTEIICPT